jgi:hypothetical protein
MSQSSLVINQRPKVNTEKIAGWETLRTCKASSLYNLNGSSPYQIQDGDYIFKTFRDVWQSNYKGSNYFPFGSFNQFCSFNIKSSGVVYCDGGVFNLWLCFLDDNYNLEENIKSNYANDHSLHNSNSWVDWFLDINITYYIDNNGSNCFSVNGYFTHANDSIGNYNDNSSLVPISGEFFTTNNNILFDIRNICQNNTTYIKEFTIDYTE